jgi:6-phosphofructokinase 1
VSFIEQPNAAVDFTVAQLGPRKVASPYRACSYVNDHERTLYETGASLNDDPAPDERPLVARSFELAGPRREIYFDAAKTRCGIVTCGGLCPGLNDVIRAIVLNLHFQYGVRTIHGFRYGFEGLVPQHGHDTVALTPATVSHIHEQGGSILASSRGPQDPGEMVDALERLNVQVLFCIGGDGTFRGALALHDEIRRRELKIAIVAIPKTIDNDIPYTSRTFGFETAYSIAADAIRGAHVEARGTPNGVGLVKLMGRHAGFIAAHAVLANRDANFVLVPEVEFDLAGTNGFLPHLYRRLKKRQHAVVVVAEGAGQNYFAAGDGGGAATDASGNAKLKDIGLLLKERIAQYLKLMEIPFSVKYIDPSYLIRSAPAQPSDSLFAGTLGQMAAHTGMAGKTGVFVGYWNGRFTHVPIAAAVSGRKRLSPEGNFWQRVLESTGQPRYMKAGAECFEDADEALLVDAGMGV